MIALRMMASTVLVIAVGAAVGAAETDVYPEGNVRVRLVADSVRPGTGGTVVLGVHFDIKPGWHIYWRNPGGAGLETEIRWLLPEGSETGEIRWPLPIFFEQSGGIPGYGYEGSVVLASEVALPPSANGGFKVGAEISWLACKGVCVLGSAALEADFEGIVDEAAIRRWRQSLPEPSNADARPFSVRVTGGGNEGGLSLWLQWQEPPPTVEFFPAPPDGLEVSGVRVQNRADLTRIDADLRWMAGSREPADRLYSLVVATLKDGRRRGWELSVTLEN